MTSANQRIFLALFTAVGLGSQGIAYAAQHTTVAESPSAVTTVSEEEITRLPKRPIDELVTTARRTEENVLEVPLAITTFNADAIEEAQITDLTDVAGMTPGFSYQNYFGQDLSVPTIRGVS